MLLLNAHYFYSPYIVYTSLGTTFSDCYSIITFSDYDTDFYNSIYSTNFIVLFKSSSVYYLFSCSSLYASEAYFNYSSNYYIFKPLRNLYSSNFLFVS